MKVNSRIAFWFYRQLDKFHSGLPGCPASFSGVAVGAGTNKIFPTCGSAAAFRNDMVERKFVCGEFFAAILAAIGVAGEYVAPVEFDFVSRQPVVE
jgi:hypothetical protein